MENVELAPVLVDSEGRPLGCYPGHGEGSAKDKGLAGAPALLGRLAEAAW